MVVRRIKIWKRREVYMRRCHELACQSLVTSHQSLETPNLYPLIPAFKLQGSGLASGVCRPLIEDEREGAGSTGSEGSAGVAVHFVILSGEKHCMLKNGLSEA